MIYWTLAILSIGLCVLSAYCRHLGRRVADLSEQVADLGVPDVWEKVWERGGRSTEVNKRSGAVRHRTKHMGPM